MKNEKLPETIWFLRCGDGTFACDSSLIGSPLLVYRSEKSASIGASELRGERGIDCTPVEIRVTEGSC